MIAHSGLGRCDRLLPILFPDFLSHFFSEFLSPSTCGAIPNNGVSVDNARNQKAAT
jgi:hypothetical protein